MLASRRAASATASSSSSSSSSPSCAAGARLNRNCISAAAAVAASSSSPASSTSSQRTRSNSRRRGASLVTAVLTQHAEEAAVARGGGFEAMKKARLITAIKTPYLSNGRIDLDAYDALVAAQLAAGVDGLVIGGTTGEGQLMSWDEHVMLIAHTVNAFGGKSGSRIGSGSGSGSGNGSSSSSSPSNSNSGLLVVGNTGSNATREALHATEQGFAVGMDASLQINPYYGKTSATGLLRHFGAALSEGPAMLYNVPGRTGQDIPDDVVLSLAQSHPDSFLGVKECTGNDRIARYAARGVRCWSGNDDEAHAARHQQEGPAAGVVSVASNLIPGAFASLMRERDDNAAAAVAPLIDWLFVEPNPIALNTALAMCGLCKPVFRLPYVPLNRAQRERGAELLRDAAARGWLLPTVDPDAIRPLEDDEFKLVSRY